MMKRCKRLFAVRTRQYERAHAAVVAAEIAREAAASAHRTACGAIERMLVRPWETSGLERATASGEGLRVHALSCAETVARAAEVQGRAAFARRRAEQALQTVRAQAERAALRREQTEHDERAARRRR
jgi:hypothetical protein